jgi:hypothetical protein
MMCKSGPSAAQPRPIYTARLRLSARRTVRLVIQALITDLFSRLLIATGIQEQGYEQNCDYAAANEIT